MSIEAVDYVFTRLAAEYGAAWDRSFGQAPINDVKSVWADRLSDFTHSDAAKKAILWALKNLPDRCPNAIEFRNLCRQAPMQEAATRIENGVQADPERVKAELAKLGNIRAQSVKAPRHDPKAWEHAILAAPQGRTQTVLAMARRGAGLEQ